MDDFLHCVVKTDKYETYGDREDKQVAIAVQVCSLR